VERAAALVADAAEAEDALRDPEHVVAGGGAATGLAAVRDPPVDLLEEEVGAVGVEVA
jgi:hypothetical protein